MSAAYYKIQLSCCFGKISGLNTKEPAKTVVTHFEPTLGMVSAVEQIDHVGFLQIYMDYVGNDSPSVVDKDIKAAFEKLEREQGTSISWERFREVLIAQRVAHFAYCSDSSNPKLTRETGVQPFWDFLIKTLKNRPRESGRKPNASLESCLEWTRTTPAAHQEYRQWRRKPQESRIHTSRRRAAKRHPTRRTPAESRCCTHNVSRGR
jgi:hypothetical protein